MGTKNDEPAWLNGVQIRCRTSLRPLPVRRHHLNHGGAGPVGVHDTFRASGRATGVGESRHALAIEHRGDQGRCLKLGRGLDEVDADLRWAVRKENAQPGRRAGDQFDVIGERRIEHERVDTAVFQHVGVVLDRSQGMQRRVAVAARHDGTHREQHFDPVLRQGCDAVTLCHALRLQHLDVLADVISHGRRADKTVSPRNTAGRSPLRSSASISRSGRYIGRYRSIMRGRLQRVSETVASAGLTLPTIDIDIDFSTG